MKSKLPSFLTSPWFLLIVAAVVVAQIGIMALTKSSSSTTSSTSAVSPATPTSSAPANMANNNMNRPMTPANPTPSTPANITPNAPQPTPMEPQEMEPWEKDLDAALDDNLTDAQSVDKILALYPTFPEDGKVEAVEYLVDLVEDKDYSKIEPLLYDKKAPEEVLETLMDDLYGREEYVQLPAMLKIMQDPSHPLYEDAKENLADYLEQDYGNDVAKWKEGVDNYLKENPPEPDEDEGDEDTGE
ncbi:MAG: hypothetical protein K1X66_03225 [Verrucomicrobiae bacterium]|nr:hypothetical protein [Verrucomicrobiae bacterium]